MFTLESNIWSVLLSIPYFLTLWYVKAALISGFIAWYIWKQLNYYKSLPPGPWGIPYLGCLPFMKGPPHAWYLKRSEEYGDLFSVKLGNHLVVCVGSYKILKSLFHRQDSVGRPHTPLNDILGGLGIILSEGVLWKKQRQFLTEKLRGLGAKLWSNERLESFILMEVGDLLKSLERLNEAPVDPAMILGRHMHNVICQMTMSFRFEEDDPNFKMFNEIVTRGMKLYGLIHFGEYVKQYLKLPGKQAVLEEIKRNHKEVSNFHAEYLRSRMLSRLHAHHPPEPVDILDFFLERLEKERNVDYTGPTIFPDVEPESQILQVMNDLFSAGMETSRTAILWCLIMMLREKEAAKKVREELSKHCQIGQQVTIDKRPVLPYVESTIFETLRMVSVVPLGTTHVNTSPWDVGPYIIPAGTHIIPLINKMSMDPEVYPEPHLFKPERFIKNGKFHMAETFAQFGVGQRMCLGANLARIELFLFFANIMNNYEFSLPEGRELPGLEGVLGSTHAPLPYELCFKKLEQ